MNSSDFVVMREWPREQFASQSRPGEASLSLVLASLQNAERIARLDGFTAEAAARATGSAIYRTRIAVNGLWNKPPSHAVCAIWEVKNLAHASAFVESRQQLFTLRQRVLPSFAADWLLQDCDHAGRYMVVGFYGNEEGATRLCREHPEIKQFAVAHPANQYTAVDLSGLLCWRIESLTQAAGTV